MKGVNPTDSTSRIPKTFEPIQNGLTYKESQELFANISDYKAKQIYDLSDYDAMCLITKTAFEAGFRFGYESMVKNSKNESKTPIC